MSFPDKQALRERVKFSEPDESIGDRVTQAIRMFAKEQKATDFDLLTAFTDFVFSHVQAGLISPEIVINELKRSQIKSMYVRVACLKLFREIDTYTFWNKIGVR